jgi:hypothetical protein
MDCVSLNFVDIYETRNEGHTKKLIDNKKTESNLVICSDFCKSLFNCFFAAF